MFKTKPIHLIVAQELNGIIGHGPKMPGWQVTDDYKLNFTPKTTANPCIMGSTTALSLGNPLKERPCIAVTTKSEKRKELLEKGFSVSTNFWAALSLAQESFGGSTIWCMGGGETYLWFLENCPPKEIHLTNILGSYTGKNEVKFCNFSNESYTLDPSRRLYFKKRPPKTNSDKDRGNSDDAIVEVYVRDY